MSKTLFGRPIDEIEMKFLIFLINAVKSNDPKE